MPEIHVCTVLPAALGTPIYRSAGNYFGRTARAIIPVYSPESAARIVVRLVERPRAEALVGTVAYALMLAARLAPRVLGRTRQMLRSLGRLNESALRTYSEVFQHRHVAHTRLIN